MKVAKGLMVRCEYDLRVAGGEVLESSRKSGPIVYQHGSGQLLPVLEERLDGMAVGEERTGTFSAEGLPKDGPALAVPRSSFPADAKVEVGQRFEAKGPQGRPIHLEVRAVDAETVTAFALHPLTGKTLEYRVKVLSVVEAPPPVPTAAAVDLDAEELIEDG